MNWKHTSKGEYPKSKKDDEIPCLVLRAGEYRILCWNTHYECWDDEDGDDYICDKEAVEKWEYLNTIISTLNTNEVEDKSKEEGDPRDIFNRSTPYFSFIG